jgi:perosamine synthetase
MLVTDDSEVYERCLTLRDHGRSRGGKMFWNNEVAFKYKMSSMQAALGLAQIERIDELVARKRDIFAWYQNELDSLPGITLNSEAPEVKNTYWMVTILLDQALGLKKEILMEELLKRNISSRPFFYPLSSLPAYRHNSHSNVCTEVSYRISPYGVNLPSALNLTPDVVHGVCEDLKAILLAAKQLVV